MAKNDKSNDQCHLSRLRSNLMYSQRIFFSFNKTKWASMLHLKSLTDCRTPLETPTTRGTASDNLCNFPKLTIQHSRPLCVVTGHLLICTKHKAQQRPVGMVLVLQAIGPKPKYWMSYNFDLMMALEEKLGDHQSHNSSC